MRSSRMPGRLGRGIDRLRTDAAGSATQGAQRYDQWQARNKMESEHYADQQKDALLERLSTDEAFRTAAAGGDAVAADRLAARADAQVHKRRMDDAALLISLAEWTFAITLGIAVVAIFFVYLRKPHAVKARFTSTDLVINDQSFPLAKYRSFRIDIGVDLVNWMDQPDVGV